jgi:GMP synthase-like glutamine amidotransferase
MIFLIINMYKEDALFHKFKKGYIYSLKGNKLIFKKWDDSQGIRRTLKNKEISGIIISGSDYFVKDSEHSIIDKSIMRSNIPILAICYGFQYIVSKYGLGKNSFIKSNKDGYMIYDSSLSISMPFYISKTKYFFYHTDYIVKVPKAFKVIKKIRDKIMIAYNSKKNILGVQFHPEKYKRSSRVFFDLWISGCVGRK